MTATSDWSLYKTCAIQVARTEGQLFGDALRASPAGIALENLEDGLLVGADHQSAADKRLASKNGCQTG